MQYATGWQWFLSVMNKVLHLSDQNLYRYTKKQKQYKYFGRDHEVSRDSFFVYWTNTELFHLQLGSVVHFLQSSVCSGAVSRMVLLGKKHHNFSRLLLKIRPNVFGTDFSHP